MNAGGKTHLPPCVLKNDKSEKCMKSRNKEKHSVVYKILFCLFGAIFLLGFGIIIYHLSISYRAKALNNDLQKEIYRSSMRPPDTAFLVRKGETAPNTASNGDPNRDSMEEAGEKTDAEAWEKNSQEEQEQQYQRQISMDFTALREINPDAVAWLKYVQ